MSQPKPTNIKPVNLPQDFDLGLEQWLLEQAKTYELQWLLAHVDDGVIWGRIAGEQLILSSQLDKENTPKLRVETLQQLRLFGPTGELYLWQGDEKWHGRLIDASVDETEDSFARHYLLWGNLEENRNDHFVLLADGVEGLRHAPPLPAQEFAAKEQHLALSVRHYLAYDDDGQAYVAASRLVSIEAVKRKQPEEPKHDK